MRFLTGLFCLSSLILSGCGGAGSPAKTATGPSVALTLTPSTATINTGQNAKFTATIVGTTNNAVQWKATGGAIDGSGNYTAGSNPGTYTITAISQADSNVSATATVTVAATPVNLSVSPATATLQTGQQKAFTATVTGSSNTAVTWSASCGSITSSGQYTAGNSAGTCTVTAASQVNPSSTASATVSVTAPPPPPPPPPSSNRLFTNASANWLYSAPTGTGKDISGTTSAMSFSLDTHDGGFDYPVQYTDGTHGCTTFTDTRYYGYKDNICVPDPANGFQPSVGGWGANDGHLVVVNTATRTYYDFWKLLVDSSGNPSSTNVGQIVSGSLDTSNGTPGTTAAVITGLAGDILPGELDCATCLQHALQAVVPGNMNSGNVCHQGPAEKTDGGVSGAVFCEGAKLRFDPSINVDSLPVSTAVKAIMKALQLYGAVITDQSGGHGVAFYTALPKAPDLTGINLLGQHMQIYY